MDKFNMDLTLEPVLANICQQLANFFGTTTETVIDNAPEFLAKYGWFSMLSDLGADIVFYEFSATISRTFNWHCNSIYQ